MFLLSRDELTEAKWLICTKDQLMNIQNQKVVRHVKEKKIFVSDVSRSFFYLDNDEPRLGFKRDGAKKPINLDTSISLI